MRYVVSLFHYAALPRLLFGRVRFVEVNHGVVGHRTDVLTNVEN